MEKILISTAVILCVVGILVLLFCFKKKKREKEEKKKENKKIMFSQIDSFFDAFEDLKSTYITNQGVYEFIREWQHVYFLVKEDVEERENERVKEFLYIFDHLYEIAERENEKFDDPEGNYEEWIVETENRVRSSIKGFYKDFDMLKTSFITKPEAAQFEKEYQDEYEFVKSANIYKSEDVCVFINDYENLRWLVEEANREYIEKEKEAHRELFQNIDGMALDDQQQTAVIADELYNLVIAGAGSGKTLTIAGKVKYLCDCHNVKPEDILLVTFTNKAVEEMDKRVNQRLGVNVKATTFHKLGLDILRGNGEQALKIVENPREFIEKYFRENILKSPEMMKKLLKYFAYYITMPANLGEFNSVGEAYEYEKTADLETIKSKYQRALWSDKKKKGKGIKDDGLSPAPEIARSLDEVEIANFLFLNGIEYEYQKIYSNGPADDVAKIYRVNFYLPKYDLWLEHVNINKEGKAPWLSEAEEQKYLQEMERRRCLHRERGTTLIETYHHYSADGCLIDKLKEVLRSRGVEFKKSDYAEVFEKIYGKETDRYFAEFINLCCTFLVLFKSNGYAVSDLPNLSYVNISAVTPYKEKKLRLFKEIVGPVIEEYQTYLEKENAIDFSDMINKAAEAVLVSNKVHPYKHIIVDEYQDVSVAQYHLIKNLIDRTGAHLFCVGDDWQSIYRFAGSDIGLFTEFEERFGHAAITALKKTYRNSIGLISEAGDFIMRNPNQMKKVLTSKKDLDYPISFIGYKESPNGALKWSMDKIIQKFGQKSSILLLGRTQHDLKVVQESGLFEIGKDKAKLKYRANPKVPVTFLTIHKAKGLEADNVILLSFENKLLGVPNKIADDPILESVLSLKEPYRYAEERRLLYVALTRTKNRVFVLADTGNPSEFLREFEASQNIFMSKEVEDEGLKLPCPRCKTGHLVVRVNERTGNNFLGCSNYPKCEYTLSDLSVLTDRKVCPECGGYMVKKVGKYGEFYQCSNHPICHHIEGRTCPECGSKLVIRDSKYGKFVGCSNYPNCKYSEKGRG